MCEWGHIQCWHDTDRKFLSIIHDNKGEKMLQRKYVKAPLHNWSDASKFM